MTSTPKTGVWLFPESAAPHLVSGIVRAEELGLDELWLGDEGPAREPFAILAAAAQVTSGIGLGIGITNPYVRHPALATTSALTVHELSGGRVMLGVGAGGQLSLGPFALTAHRPVGAVERFITTAGAVQTGQSATDYQPPNMAIDGSIVPRAMPIYVGGRGPRMNRLASKRADGAFVAGLPPFRYDEVIGWAREHNPIDIALYPSVAFDEEAVDHHRPEMIWSLLDAPPEVCASLGVDPEALPQAAEALRQGDRRPATAIITDELLPHLILNGSPTEVGRLLAGLVQRHRPTSIGLALLQPDLGAGLDDAAEAFDMMRLALGEDARVTGVIGHIANPTRSDAVALAVAAEQAGANWIGLADAFWWRDVWMLLESVAQATEHIEIGPAMTNPYLRHNFHTASALATLHESAPERGFCGIAAGGSEITVAANISRADAAERSRRLVEMLRLVAEGGLLDADSGRTLDIALPPTPVLMAGRGDKMLAAAGAMADRVLLWAIPQSDLGRSVDIIRRAADASDRTPRLIWAPLVRHRDIAARSLGHPAVYAALNTASPIRRTWGLDDGAVEELRGTLVSGRLEEAIDMVPPAAMADLVLDPTDVDGVAARARSLGVSEIAVPGFSAASVATHLAWAESVEAKL